MRRIALLLVPVALAACGGSAATVSAPTTAEPIASGAGAKTYPIHLSSPSRVGERLHVVAEDRTDKTVVQDGGTVDEKHGVVHIDAVGTTVAVDDRGRTTRDHYDVKELMTDGRSLGVGSVDVTRAPKEKDAVVLVGGAPATDEVRAALSDILSLSTGGPSDDDVFGTQQPQAIGAHWPVNTRLARDDLRDSSGVDAAKVTGDVWLAGLTHAEGGDCLDVRARLGLEGIELPGLPPGSTIDQSHAVVDLEGTFPLGERMVRATEALTMSMEVRIRVPTPSGKDSSLTVTMTSKRTARYIRL